MSKFLKNVLKATPVVLGASLMMASGAIAGETSASQTATQTGTNNANSQILNQVNNYNKETPTDSLSQVNNVFQLRDVSPGDWAFEALRNLTERYGCIAGYPDSTFRGNKAMTRYEFAAGLNSCLQQIERLIGTGGTTAPDMGDMSKIQRLVQEFQGELATLASRVDNLEGRIGSVEENQFSTTTKLSGQVVFTLGAGLGDKKAGSAAEVDDNLTFSDRVRLNFNTSFTGKDLLRTRLQAGNFNSLVGATGTDMARLAQEEGGGNSFTVDDLWYRFPLGKKATAFVGANSFNMDDIFDTGNPNFGDNGNGALSRFTRYNPVVFRATTGAGAGLKYKFSDKFNFTAAYFGNDKTASDPTPGKGIFDGSYSAAAQLGFMPMKTMNLAFTYVHSYQTAGNVDLSGSTGSANAKNPFGAESATSERLGIQANWKIAPKISIGGWGGFVSADSEMSNKSAEVWTWLANVALLDFGKEGNVLGLMFGQPPKLTSSEGTGAVAKDGDSSYLVEAQYRYKLSDNITLTPGGYVIFNPNHSDKNDTVWVGTLRTTFSF